MAGGQIWRASDDEVDQKLASRVQLWWNELTRNCLHRAECIVQYITEY